MALEVKVYRDFRSYKPKVMFGLTVRQLVLMIPIVLLGGGVWAAAYASGHTSVGVYAVILVVAPFVLLGWYQPHGMRLETWLRTVHRFRCQSAVSVYRQKGMEIDNVRMQGKTSRNSLGQWETLH